MPVGDHCSLQLMALSVACICLTSLVTLSELEPKSVPHFISTNWLQRKYRPLQGEEKGRERRELEDEKRKNDRAYKCDVFSCSLFPFNLSSSFQCLVLFFTLSFSLVTDANPPFMFIV